jgi:hypothetical protein
MGTHAMIGIWNSQTGEVTASYVHYDGYVAGVGAELVSYYNNNERATLVATGGYLSSLSSDYVESRSSAVNNLGSQSFDSVQAFLDEGFTFSGSEYLYLWDGSAWFVAMNTLRGFKAPFEEVELSLDNCHESL